MFQTGSRQSFLPGGVHGVAAGWVHFGEHGLEMWRVGTEVMRRSLKFEDKCGFKELAGN